MTEKWNVFILLLMEKMDCNTPLDQTKYYFELHN